MSDHDPWASPPPPAPKSSSNPFVVALIAVLLVPVIAIIGGLTLASINDDEDREGNSVIESDPEDDYDDYDDYDDELDPAPSTGDFGTAAEIGTRGDDGNPGELFLDAYPSVDDTQERIIGQPARFSGYTTWVHSIERVPATGLVDGYTGDYLKLGVTIFNRDVEPQSAGAADFYVWSENDGRRNADVVSAPTIAGYTTMDSGETIEGDVYLYVGSATNIFVVYDPDHDEFSGTATGVWRAG